jgi:hypothetical protein
MRRLVLVAGALVLPVLPLHPASAVTPPHVICVASPGGTCNETATSIQNAIAIAGTNNLDNVISVGAGMFADGPYTLTGTVHALTLRGVGPATVVTLPSSGTAQHYITADHATVSNLKISMAPDDAANDYGMVLYDHSSADHVTVDGSGTVQAVGAQLIQSTLTDSSVLLPPASSAAARAIYSSGGNIVSDTTITGSTGYSFSDPNSVDNLSRVSIRADYQGVAIDSGTINLDDSVIDLGTGTNSVGLNAANPNAGTDAKAINANHVTIVGGSTDSVGAQAESTNDTVAQESSITLANSIIQGPATSLVASAGNSGGGLSPSTATINVSYSDYHSPGGVIGANATGGVVRGAGNVDVDPRFVSAATGDYHLAAGSPGVDKGSPAAGGPTTDRDGHARVTDGDGNGTKVTDMGAYERPTLDRTPPNTRLTAHPAHKVRTATVRFVFASTEAHSTFRCKLDKRAYKTCTAPHRISIGIGKHTFSVKAVDASGNIDPSAVTWKVQRLKKRHR